MLIEWVTLVNLYMTELEKYREEKKNVINY